MHSQRNGCWFSDAVSVSLAVYVKEILLSEIDDREIIRTVYVA